MNTGKNPINKGKRQRKRPFNRWTKEQTVSLLRAVMGKVKGDPGKFEKPTSNKFYNSIFQEYCLEELEELGAIICKNKMRNLKNSFIKAEEWIEETGANLYEDGQQDKYNEHLNKLCPHYKDLVNIFGVMKRETKSFTIIKNDIQFIEMNNTQDNLSTEYDGDETVSEEHQVEQSYESESPGEADYTMSSVGNINNPLLTTMKSKSSVRLKQPNSLIQYMSMTQEKRNEIEENKLDGQKVIEEERSKIDVGILELKRQKLDFYRKMEEKRFDLEKKKIEGELELKRVEIEKQYDLKKYELELKYKCNNN